MTAKTAIGIDIGGTGIKGAVVDLSTGELLTDRVKLPTPHGGRPQDIIETTRTLLATVVAKSGSDFVRPTITHTDLKFLFCVRKGFWHIFTAAKNKIPPLVADRIGDLARLH